jgi:phospholipid N-methyltransferase
VLLAHGEIITDSRNTVAEDIARGQLHHRQSVVRNVPPAFLVN